MTKHPAHPPSGASGARVDHGSWISGPCQPPGRERPEITITEAARLLAGYSARWSIECDGHTWSATRKRGSQVVTAVRQDIRDLVARLAEMAEP